MNEGPDDIDLSEEEWTSDRNVDLRATWAYAITVIVLAYPVGWAMHHVVEWTVRPLTRLLLGLPV